MFDVKKFIITIFIIFSLNNAVYSAEDAKGAKSDGSDDSSFLILKNSNYKKGYDALVQAEKYKKKGKVNKATQRFNDSINFFIQANKENPNDANILNYLGSNLREIGDIMMAEIYYEQGLAIEPEHININKNLGNLYFETNRIEKAREILKVIKNCACDEYVVLKNLIK